MRIDFSYLNQTTNADREVYGKETHSAAVQKSDNSGYQMDISGIVMDNAAYGLGQKQSHGKTLEECMQEIGQQDVALQHNYLAVMSNSLSAEDLAKMMEDGVDPRKIPVEDAVTITDKIKASLVQAGVDVAGYTDTLDSEDLRNVTGDTGQAAAIERKLKENDLPVTQRNVDQSKEAIDLIKDVEHLSEGAIKYMVENQMPPTIENLYFAQFSSGNNSNAQPRGYFAVNGAGYYAKKADAIDWEQIEPQMKKIIEEAGLVVSEDTMKEAGWLIEKGVPLTKESLNFLHNISGISFPVDTDRCMDAVADAISNGKDAKSAALDFDKSTIRKAQEIVDAVKEITDEQVEDVVKSGRDLTIENLLQKENNHKENKQNLQQSYDETAAKRFLEETRLLMTTEANLKLLKSGYSIETAELSELVEELKAVEQQFYHALMGRGVDHADEKIALYKETQHKTSALAAYPAAVLGKVRTTDTFTLDDIYVEGSRLKSEYDKANQSYEALRTEVRKDLGDSIRKAFRNVDDILEDMGLSKTPENQRAVRILGYNSMEITQENVQRVKEADHAVNELLDKMTPQMTLNLIRDGVNPLKMDVESLNRKISEYSDTVVEQTEKYSEFLFKLEKNNQITEEEKESYIGIYRLLHQIENTDGAAIGSVVNQENALSLKNLLSAIRSSKKTGMDISVDHNFGGIDPVSWNGASITEQIESAFHEMDDFLSDQNTKNEYYEEIKKDIQAAAETETQVIEELLRFDQPVTVDNVLSQNILMNFRGSMFKNLFEKAEETGKSEELTEQLENLYENMDNAESAGQAYEALAEKAEEVLSKSLDMENPTLLDVRQLNLLCKELSLTKSLSSEEKYEVPVETEDGYTSIRLTIRHGDGDKKVEASMQTETHGKIAAEFSITNGQIDGYIIGSKEESLTFLNQVKEEMADFFEHEGRDAKPVMVSISSSLDINKSIDDDYKNDSKVDTRDLYGIAKQFIHAVRRNISMEKEGAENEN